MVVSVKNVLNVFIVYVTMIELPMIRGLSRLRIFLESLRKHNVVGENSNISLEENIYFRVN